MGTPLEEEVRSMDDLEQEPTDGDEEDPTMLPVYHRVIVNRITDSATHMIVPHFSCNSLCQGDRSDSSRLSDQDEAPRCLSD